MEKVSVIIPTFNRFECLLHAIRSVLNQTYTNIEIIIVNDCSTEQEYYSFDFQKAFGEKVYVVHLPKNSRQIYGDVVVGGGHSRNIGMMLASGEYIAFLDDDDYFLPTKIAKQVAAMKSTNCAMSCTEAYGGNGKYDPTKTYRTWHYQGIYWSLLHKIFHRKLPLLHQMYKDSVNVWTPSALHAHNCTCGGSSIVVKRSLVEKAGYFPICENAEDWKYWKQLIQYSNCVHLREPLTYIDRNHGGGRQYQQKHLFIFPA